MLHPSHVPVRLIVWGHLKVMLPIVNPWKVSCPSFSQSNIVSLTMFYSITYFLPPLTSSSYPSPSTTIYYRSSLLLFHISKSRSSYTPPLNGLWRQPPDSVHFHPHPCHRLPLYRTASINRQTDGHYKNYDRIVVINLLRPGLFS